MAAELAHTQPVILPVITSPDQIHNDQLYRKLFPYISSLHTCPDPKKTEPVRPDPLEWPRYFRRWVWRGLTFNGILVDGFIKFQGVWMIALSVFLGQSWGEFFKNHVEALFQDGMKELPNAWQEFAFCAVITLAAASLMAVFTFVDNMYHWILVPEYRIVNRQRFRGLWATAKRYQPYLNDHDWDYNSDECPDEAVIWYRKQDTVRQVCKIKEMYRRKGKLKDEPPAQVKAAEVAQMRRRFMPLLSGQGVV